MRQAAFICQILGKITHLMPKERPGEVVQVKFEEIARKDNVQREKENLLTTKERSIEDRSKSLVNAGWFRAQVLCSKLFDNIFNNNWGKI